VAWPPFLKFDFDVWCLGSQNAVLRGKAAGGMGGVEVGFRLVSLGGSICVVLKVLYAKNHNFFTICNILMDISICHPTTIPVLT
jgi:hypothetical protein